MGGQRLGSIVRALRRRHGWRQLDLAERVGCSQHTVSMIERGHIASLSTALVGRTLAALDATLVIDVRWRGGALDRLLDEDRAALVGHVAEVLGRHGWIVEVEVTYSEFGERGSFDILAFHSGSGIVLAIEVKTELPSIEGTLRKLDEKARLAAKVARDRFGWQARGVSRLLVVSETSTARRRAARHAAVLDAHLPHRAIAVRNWLRTPTGTLRGLWFLSTRHPRTAMKRTGGRDRVRVARTPSPRPHQAG
ncbi:MAG: helix-turn-helix transcriptional regulator [Candidatus Limnocylindrales bacterium]